MQHNQTKSSLNLPTDYALVLQQIQEDGEDDLVTLERTLHLNRSKLWQIIKALQNRGLVSINTTYDEAWIRLSRKGSQLVKSIWPESAAFA